MAYFVFGSPMVVPGTLMVLYTHLINFFMNYLVRVLNIGTLHRSSRMKTLKSLGNLVQVHLELCTTENGGEVM
jgi:hypothetical protein